MHNILFIKEFVLILLQCLVKLLNKSKILRNIVWKIIAWVKILVNSKESILGIILPNYLHLTIWTVHRYLIRIVFNNTTTAIITIDCSHDLLLLLENKLGGFVLLELSRVLTNDCIRIVVVWRVSKIILIEIVVFHSRYVFIYLLEI